MIDSWKLWMNYFPILILWHFHERVIPIVVVMHTVHKCILLQVFDPFFRHDHTHIMCGWNPSGLDQTICSWHFGKIFRIKSFSRLKHELKTKIFNKIRNLHLKHLNNCRFPHTFSSLAVYDFLWSRIYLRTHSSLLPAVKHSHNSWPSDQ